MTGLFFTLGLFAAGAMERKMVSEVNVISFSLRVRMTLASGPLKVRYSFSQTSTC